jgi:hypothetical protein
MGSMPRGDLAYFLFASFQSFSATAAILVQSVVKPHAPQITA